MIGLRRIVCLAVLAAALLGGMRVAAHPVGPSARQASVPRIVGVTVDDLGRLPAVLDSLGALPRRPWVRVVFDLDARHPADPGPYVRAVRRLARVGSVLGELVDSSDLRRLSAAQVAARTAAFVRALGRSVAVWEVGNEVNGSWTGAPIDVARKVQAAYDAVRRRNGRTALTLYENTGCGDGPGELSPLAWGEHYVPRRMRSGLEYVLLSYYEPQCAGRRPGPAAWTERFAALHRAFPRASVGFGEVGLPRPATSATRARAASLIAYYYRLPIPLSYYIGGGFYWYFAEDMVPRVPSPLWAALADAWAPAPRHSPVVRAGTAVSPPPVHAGFSYQLGGSFAVSQQVGVVDRDWHVAPAPGAYGICYVNAYQAQPDELGWWRSRHPSLLLRRHRQPVVDRGWNEQLLDTSTALKRRGIAAIVNGWIRSCARAGYRAVEPDNLDSYTRSRGALTAANNLALARQLIAGAHSAGLAIAQKNAAELASAGRHLGFDFAIAEECQAYAECGRYLATYGSRLIEIEYLDNGGHENFWRACRLRGDRISIILRDRSVTPAGRPGFLEQRCPHPAAADTHTALRWRPSTRQPQPRPPRARHVLGRRDALRGLTPAPGGPVRRSGR